MIFKFRLIKAKFVKTVTWLRFALKHFEAINFIARSDSEIEPLPYGNVESILKLSYYMEMNQFWLFQSVSLLNYFLIAY